MPASNGSGREPSAYSGNACVARQPEEAALSVRIVASYERVLLVQHEPSDSLAIWEKQIGSKYA
jgi:hypothetical protein